MYVLKQLSVPTGQSLQLNGVTRHAEPRWVSTYADDGQLIIEVTLAGKKARVEAVGGADNTPKSTAWAMNKVRMGGRRVEPCAQRREGG